MASSSESTGAALPPMALLATLQTAATVWQGVAERRAGRDPAAQEPAREARAYLRAAAEELSRLHMQLLMAKVQSGRASSGAATRGEDDGNADSSTDGSAAGDGAIEERAREEGEGPGGSAQLPPAHLAATVRRFDLLMKLRRTGRLLHGAHQRLMSLYPAVSEELVEEARHCQRDLAALHDAPGHAPGHALGASDFDTHLGFFLERLLGFAAWLEREL